MTDQRHVFVRREHDPREYPGLLLEWRRDAEGQWEARVTYIEEKLGRSVTEWAPAVWLRPIEPQAPRPAQG